MRIIFILLILCSTLFSCLNNENSKTKANVCGVEDKKIFNIDNSENQPDVYKRKCSACHFIQRDATGPKLSGILNKIPNEKWFELFIKNEDSLLKNNDKYTIKISKFSEIKNVHNFDEITKEELNELKKYIHSDDKTEIGRNLKKNFR